MLERIKEKVLEDMWAEEYIKYMDNISVEELKEEF